MANTLLPLRKKVANSRLEHGRSTTPPEDDSFTNDRREEAAVAAEQYSNNLPHVEIPSNQEKKKVLFYTSPIGKPTYAVDQSSKSAAFFDLESQRIIVPSYDGLHDPHLKSHFNNPRLKQHLESMGLLSRSGKIIGTQKEYHEAVRLARLCDERVDKQSKLLEKERQRTMKIMRAAEKELERYKIMEVAELAQQQRFENDSLARNNAKSNAENKAKEAAERAAARRRRREREEAKRHAEEIKKMLDENKRTEKKSLAQRKAEELLQRSKNAARELGERHQRTCEVGEVSHEERVREETEKQRLLQSQLQQQKDMISVEQKEEEEAQHLKEIGRNQKRQDEKEERLLRDEVAWKRRTQRNHQIRLAEEKRELEERNPDNDSKEEVSLSTTTLNVVSKKGVTINDNTAGYDQSISLKEAHDAKLARDAIAEGLRLRDEEERHRLAEQASKVRKKSSETLRRENEFLRAQETEQKRREQAEASNKKRKLEEKRRQIADDAIAAEMTAQMAVLFEDTVMHFCQMADIKRLQELPEERFISLFRSNRFNIYIDDTDWQKLKKTFTVSPSGYINYKSTVAGLRDNIAIIYRGILDMSNDWVKLFSAQMGNFYYNKRSKKVQLDMPSGYNHRALVSDNAQDLHVPDDCLERLATSIFERADTDRSGFLDTDEFWELLRSPVLNLNLSEEDMLVLRAKFDQNVDSLIDYKEFIPMCRQLLCLVYQGKDDSPNQWTEIYSEDAGVIYFNKRTGAASLARPDDFVPLQEHDLLESTMAEIFQKADADGNGVLTDLEMINLLRSDILGLNLTRQEAQYLKDQYDVNRDGHIEFHEFVPLCRKLIMLIYTKHTDGGDWVKLNSKAAGTFWFNKRTGRTSYEQPLE